MTTQLVDPRTWGPELELEQRLDEALVENDLLKHELRRSSNYLVLWLENAEIESLRRRLKYIVNLLEDERDTSAILRDLVDEAHDHIVQLESQLKKRRKK